MYHEASRWLQDEFDTRRLADRIEERIAHNTLSDGDRRFVEAQDMFFLATADDQGRPSCSYKGGDPGFVNVIDERTIAFPNYDGNGMYLSMGNLQLNPHVEILFIDFERRNRMRVRGRARIDRDPALVARWPGAQFAVVVDVDKVFPNCPRYVHQMQRVERSEFVPREGCDTPVPDWKRSDWAYDALPERDPARAAGPLSD